MSVNGLFSFLRELSGFIDGDVPIVVVGVVLPTMRRAHPAWRTWRNMTEPPSLPELTEKVRLFNEFVKANCKLLRYQYIDINSKIVNPRTGVVDDAFRAPKPPPGCTNARCLIAEEDHHLHSERTYRLWLEALLDALPGVRVCPGEELRAEGRCADCGCSW